MRVSNIEVIKCYDSDLPLLLADEYQLQQVFVNLVIDAEQAMLETHGKGRLEITTKFDHDRKTILISFQDDGPGIPEKDMSKIFDPFFTTKPVGKGTGLGLSISYSIIQEHDGLINVASDKEKGTTFTVELPVVSPELLETSVSSPTGETVKFSGKNFLVVDDESSLVALIKDTLEHQGYTVETAMSG